MSGQYHTKKSSIGGRIMDTGKKLINKFFPQEEDLTWFARLMELNTIQSDFFFEKYLVVGISDETLSNA